MVMYVRGYYNLLTIDTNLELVDCMDYNVCYTFTGENTVNGDHSDAHMSTLSQSSKEVCYLT